MLIFFLIISLLLIIVINMNVNQFSSRYLIVFFCTLLSITAAVFYYSSWLSLYLLLIYLCELIAITLVFFIISAIQKFEKFKNLNLKRGLDWSSNITTFNKSFVVSFFLTLLLWIPQTFSHTSNKLMRSFGIHSAPTPSTPTITTGPFDFRSPWDRFLVNSIHLALDGTSWRRKYGDLNIDNNNDINDKIRWAYDRRDRKIFPADGDQGYHFFVAVYNRVILENSTFMGRLISDSLNSSSSYYDSFWQFNNWIGDKDSIIDMLKSNFFPNNAFFKDTLLFGNRKIVEYGVIEAISSLVRMHANRLKMVRYFGDENACKDLFLDLTRPAHPNLKELFDSCHQDNVRTLDGSYLTKRMWAFEPEWKVINADGIDNWWNKFGYAKKFGHRKASVCKDVYLYFFPEKDPIKARNNKLVKIEAWYQERDITYPFGTEEEQELVNMYSSLNYLWLDISTKWQYINTKKRTPFWQRFSIWSFQNKKKDESFLDLLEKVTIDPEILKRLDPSRGVPVHKDLFNLDKHQKLSALDLLQDHLFRRDLDESVYRTLNISPIINLWIDLRNSVNSLRSLYVSLIDPTNSQSYLTILFLNIFLVVLLATIRSFSYKYKGLRSKDEVRVNEEETEQKTFINKPFIPAFYENEGIAAGIAAGIFKKPSQLKDQDRPLSPFIFNKESSL